MPRPATWIITLCSTLSLAACPSDDGASEVGDEASSSESSAGESTAGESETDTGGQPSGEALYTTHCAVCHGPGGEGTTIAYEIRHPHEGFATWVVRNGRASIEFAGAMPQFGSDVLPDDELALIFEYLDAQPQPSEGEALYLDYCRNCHGLDALGGVADAELVNSPIQDFVENTRQGRGGTNYGVRTLFMPARTSAELSDAEIQAIFDHVQSL